MHNTAPAPSLFQVHGLRFAYGAHRLWDGWSADFGPGVHLLLGGDGAGKSTLLRLLAGALPAQGGVLRLGGVALSADPQGYRRQVAWADPADTAGPERTVIEVFRQWLVRHPALDEAALDGHVQGLGLEDHLHKPLLALSTGSRRKVGLAASLASGAALTLIDEPFAALDHPSIRYLQVALAELAGQDARAVLVAHYEDLGAVPLAQTVSVAQGA